MDAREQELLLVLRRQVLVVVPVLGLVLVLVLGLVVVLVLVLGLVVVLVLILELLLILQRQVLGDWTRLQQELQLGGSLQHPVSGLCSDSS